MVTEFLNDIGTLISEQNILFDKHKLSYMKYINLQKDIKIEISNTGFSTNIGSGYIYNVSTNNLDFATTIPNKSLYEFINKNKRFEPKIHSYNNSQNKSNDSFIIRFNNNLTDIEMSFGKDRIVFETKNGTLIVCMDNNGYADIENIIEEYQFFENGFYCANAKDSVDNIVNNGISANFKLFTKKYNQLDYPMTNRLPTIVNYTEPFEKTFQLYYDIFGIVSNCIDISNKSQRLCRYEGSWTYKNDGTYGIFKSIHPLFYDTFDYSSLNKPLKYWAEDIVDCSGKIIILDRNIFTVEDENIKPLIKFINTLKKDRT